MKTTANKIRTIPLFERKMNQAHARVNAQGRADSRMRRDITLPQGGRKK